MAICWGCQSFVPKQRRWICFLLLVVNFISHPEAASIRQKEKVMRSETTIISLCLLKTLSGIKTFPSFVHLVLLKDITINPGLTKNLSGNIKKDLLLLHPASPAK